MDNKELLKRVKEDNVKFLSLQFTDVLGSVKSVDMPIRHLEGVLEDGAWFDGSSVEGFARIQESDMRLKIDPENFFAISTFKKNNSHIQKNYGLSQKERNFGLSIH